MGTDNVGAEPEDMDVEPKNMGGGLEFTNAEPELYMGAELECINAEPGNMGAAPEDVDGGSQMGDTEPEEVDTEPEDTPTNRKTRKLTRENAVVIVSNNPLIRNCPTYMADIQAPEDDEDTEQEVVTPRAVRKTTITKKKAAITEVSLRTSTVRPLDSHPT